MTSLIFLSKILKFVLLASISVSSSVYCDEPDPVKEIRRQIFVNYHRNVKPVSTQSKAINLGAKMHIFHVEKLNEMQQSVKIHGIFQMTWNDDFLKWDPAKFNNTKYILLQNYELWTPDIVLSNSAKQSGLDPYWNLPVKLWYPGIVYASPEFTLDVSCQFDLTDYPNDIQTCPMAFFANGLSLLDVNWTRVSDPELRMYWPDKDQKTRISEWKIIGLSTSAKYWLKGNLTDEQPNKTEWAVLPIIEMTVKFARNNVYFTVTAILPAVLTSFLTLTGLAPCIRLKNSLLILLTNFLLQCFYVDNLMDQLPLALTGLPRIVKFYVFNLCATTFAILIRIWLLLSQVKGAEKLMAEKKTAEEASNQEKLPQAQPESMASRLSFLSRFLEAKRFGFVIFGLYCLIYFIYALVYL